MYFDRDDKRHLTLSPYKIKHCEEVAKVMYDNAIFFDINPDIAYFIGLNHDIGYVNGRQDHAKNGYELLKGLGIENDFVLNAIRYHGTSPLNLQERMQIPNELKLLWIADMSVDAKGEYVGFDGRLEDIKERYGEDSIAYKTASETVDYCKEVIKERMMASKDDYEFNNLEKKYLANKKDAYFTMNIRPEKESPIGHYSKESILLKEFRINPDFVNQYALPIPDMKMKFYVDENNNVFHPVLYFENTIEDEKWFYTTLLHYLDSKNTDKIYEVMGCINVEKPIEWFREIKQICVTVLDGLDQKISSFTKNTRTEHKEFYKECISDYLKEIDFNKDTFDKDDKSEDIEEELDNKDDR